MIKYIKDLTNLNGVSGYENEVKAYMKKHLEKTADEVVCDKLGGVFGIYNGNGPKIMITAHMDEVGALVGEITKNGLIKMISIGSINPEAIVCSCLYITTTEKKKILGVVSSTPPHISKDNKLNFDDLLLDIGCSSDEEVKKLGVKVGDYITFKDEFYFTHDKKKIVNKGMDDRLGCGVILELASLIKNLNHPNTIILGGTVQEEVGLRGARVSSNMIQPDLFITVDVSPADDYLGKDTKIGNGFLVRYYDPVTIMNPNLLNYFKELATKNKLKFQEFKSKGGTDAGSAQFAGKGVLATTVGIPGRYIHSPHTMVSISDIKEAVKFITKLIEEFNTFTLERLQS